MGKKGSFAGELALTKSAAWAWLERRSGSDGWSMPEFDVSRTKFDARPSRYKVEAARKLEEKTKSSYYSLLDRYDIERISRQLDLYIEPSGRNCRGDRRSEAVAATEMKSKHRGQVLSSRDGGRWKIAAPWRWNLSAAGCLIK